MADESAGLPGRQVYQILCHVPLHQSTELELQACCISTYWQWRTEEG